MVSEFRKKKILYLLKITFNLDQSSSIGKKDFEQSLEYISNIQGWDKNGKLYKEVQDMEVRIWEGLSKKKEKISADEWIALWDVRHGDLSEWQKLYCKVSFLVQDSTGDGVVDEEEFLRAHEAFGIPKEEAKEAFQKMTQGKTSISWEEFQQLFKEFLQSEDINAPGNYIFGSTKVFVNL